MSCVVCEGEKKNLYHHGESNPGSPVVHRIAWFYSHRPASAPIGSFCLYLTLYVTRRTETKLKNCVFCFWCRVCVCVCV